MKSKKKSKTTAKKYKMNNCIELQKIFSNKLKYKNQNKKIAKK